MTQARSGAAFSLQLTPMQVPESVPSTELALAVSGGQPRSMDAPTALDLVVRPGEPSELVVQIRNQRRMPIRLQMQVEGNFPPHWCRIGTEGHALAPGQQMDAVLYFAIAPDFLEQPRTAEQLPLQLNYQGRLIVSSQDDSGHRYSETSRFQLYIRPRSLYLNFLPDLYRDIDFVGRFLKLFEQAFEPAVHTLDTLWAHLDPLTAPQALLPFLSHWVGWSLQVPISIERQRFLIRHAMQIYRWRGTRRGLRFFLHLVTGLPLDEHLTREGEKHIGIHENFSQGFVTGAARLGEDAILGGNRPYHFVVHLRCDPGYPIDLALVRRIIEQEKPAFCTYDLKVEHRSGSTPLLDSSAA